MSKRSPGFVIGIALGIAVVVSLAQLGLVSGLAVVIWRDGTAAEWAGHLSWGAWLAAVSTVSGALVAARFADDLGSRVMACVSAAIGSFVVAPLIAVPAMRFADSGITGAPFAAVGTGCAVGLVVAALGLLWRPVSRNVVAGIAITWVLAVLAAFVPIGDDRADVVRLGVWGSWADLVPEIAPPMLLGSLLAGAVTAWVSGRRDDADHRAVAVSGAAGPLLVIGGYLAARQPAVGVDTDWTGIWMGSYAALAGLLGSLLVAALTRPPVPRTAGTEPATPAGTVPAAAEQAVPESAARTEPEPEPVAVTPEPEPDRTYQIPAAPVDTRFPAEPDPHDTAALGEWAEEPQAPAPREPEPEPEPVVRPKRAKRKRARTPDAVEAAPAAEVTSSADDPVAAETPDETESWVCDLRDDNAFAEQREREAELSGTEPPTPKKRMFGRRKKDD